MLQWSHYFVTLNSYSLFQPKEKEEDTESKIPNGPCSQSGTEPTENTAKLHNGPHSKIGNGMNKIGSGLAWSMGGLTAYSEPPFDIDLPVRLLTYSTMTWIAAEFLHILFFHIGFAAHVR